LKSLEDKILEEKNRMIALKYNVLYSLNYDDSPASIEELYDQLEENIKKLKEQRDKIKIKMYQKEERKKKAIKEINDEIETLKFNYKEIPEDRKELYLEIQSKRDSINEILNNDRSIIVTEKNKKNIYCITTDYNPIRDNEISIDVDYESNANGSNTNGSNSSKLESENLD
jgi:chromosome segregation ATPase